MILKRLCGTLILLCAAACLFYGRLWAAPGGAGSMVEAYVNAYNSGDPEVMSRFLQENFTQAGDLSERIANYSRLWKETGKISLQGLRKRGPGDVMAHAETEKGESLTLHFELEPQQPYRIVQIRFEAGDGEEEPAGPRLKSDAELVEAVGGYLKDVSDRDEFSGVVLVAKNNAPLFHQAYGMSNRSCMTPNRIDTKFNLGSINKIFTRIAVAQLLEEKKLNLDDLVGKHDPDYPNRSVEEKVTIRHLLDMSSGMGDIFSEKYFSISKDRLRKLADYLPLFVNDPLQFEPGTGKEYSNAGYILLGLLIEKITGEDYYDYMKQRIFRPLEMNDTDWYFSDMPVPNTAEGYTNECEDASTDCGRRSNALMRPARGSSAGGGYSTALDLARFAAFLKAPTIVSAHNPLLPKEGIGVGGGAPGINAMLEVSGRYTIVVLSNYDPPAAEKVGKRIRAWLPSEDPAR